MMSDVRRLLTPRVPRSKNASIVRGAVVVVVPRALPTVIGKGNGAGMNSAVKNSAGIYSESGP